ncbi:cell division protein ZapA [Salinarimonas ramus]|uniref:Cell division protein ZapA n=1 Tax=Salinarimonas ramus TaxID=690164 RepID=A0A917QCS9_9HYPH|nr:cell division protein ZapA [Salinarimonas ramus]GGK44202.1 cell division protein ZapA [Salinarimonas ramus]
MPQISVLIAGKTYRMACGEGEEARLEGLAAMLDGKITEMRAAFGEIGDMRLQVMAAITFADLLVDAQTRISALEAEKAELATLLANADERRQTSEDKIAVGVVRAAERVERLAKSLAIGQQGAASPGTETGGEPGTG